MTTRWECKREVHTEGFSYWYERDGEKVEPLDVLFDLNSADDLKAENEKRNAILAEYLTKIAVSLEICLKRPDVIDGKQMIQEQIGTLKSMTRGLSPVKEAHDGEKTE